MAILNPDHLFEQAERLIAPLLHGPPRQVDLRRAISSAYYALFHFVLTSAANELVGTTHQATGRYRLVYRSIDHKTLFAVCGDAIKRPAPPKYVSSLPKSGFGPKIRAFAFAARELQQKRMLADYDPVPRFKTADALFAVRTARQSLAEFQAAPEIERKIFLTLLVCPPRS